MNEECPYVLVIFRDLEMEIKVCLFLKHKLNDIRKRKLKCVLQRCSSAELQFCCG